MSYGIYLLNIKALQISYGSFFRKLLTKPKWRKCPICSDTGYIAGIEQRAESNAGKERNAARQQSRGGARSIWQHCKTGGKIFLSFSVCHENIQSSLIWPCCLHSCRVPMCDSQSLLTFHQHTKPVLSAVPHSPEEHLVKDPAAGVKSPSVSDNGLTAGHGEGLKWQHHYLLNRGIARQLVVSC